MPIRTHTSHLPTILQPLSTEEYRPPPYSGAGLRAARRVGMRLPEIARYVNRPVSRYAASRLGTAVALRALNREYGEQFYHVPAEAETDEAAADATLGGDQAIIDVEVHYIADKPGLDWFNDGLLQSYGSLMANGFKGLEGMTRYNVAEFLRCVFLESDNTVAVLSSPPGLEHASPLTNAEMSGTRELFERFGGSGRLLNHCVVHPKGQGQIDQIGEWRDQHKPVGWKVYTPGLLTPAGWAEGSGWMLDDEDVGIPLLRRIRESGVRIVCSHKGLSGRSPEGSPRDVGPVAAAFPDLQFLIYHAGYEIPETSEDDEGPYSEEGRGVDRLIKSLKDARISPGANVYAELGTTWFALIKRPREAAHVLGKLLLAFGEDNVLWGTDSIWYGPTQPVVDAFRAFQIPEEYRQRYGYPQLTAAVKEKILGLSAARVYGIDVTKARTRAQTDDLGWARAALQEYKAKR